MTDLDNEFMTMKDLAVAVGRPLNSVNSLRQRGHWPAWDGVPQEQDYDDGWHRYSVLDAALVSGMIEMIESGIAAKVAASILGNNRGPTRGSRHPNRPSDDDVWIGVLRFDEGAAHVGGRFPEVVRDITKSIRRDIENSEDGGGSSAVLINISKHVRRVRRALLERTG